MAREASRHIHKRTLTRVVMMKYINSNSSRGQFQFQCQLKLELTFNSGIELTPMSGDELPESNIHVTILCVWSQLNYTFY